MANPRSTPRKPSVSRPQQSHPAMEVAKMVADFVLAMILIAAIVLASWMAYKRLTQHAFFPLKRVVIEQPLIFADGEDLTEVVSTYGHLDMLHIDVNVLAQEMAKISWVKSVKIKKQWPDALEVDVVERVPILRWGDKDFLDSEARHFRLPESSGLQALFAVRGPEGSEAEVLEMYRVLHPWFNAQNMPLEGLTLDNRRVWRVRLKDGIEVILGREEINQRLKKLVVVNQRIIQRYRQYIDLLDLRYQDGFSVRWKAGVTPMSSQQNEPSS